LKTHPSKITLNQKSRKLGTIKRLLSMRSPTPAALFVAANSESEQPRKRCPSINPHMVLRATLLSLLIATIVVLFGVIKIHQQIPHVADFINTNVTRGFFIYFAVGTLTTVIGMPLSILSIGAGFLFRPLVVACALLAAITFCGCLISLIVGRYLIRDWLLQTRFARNNRSFAILRRAIRAEGWKIVMMLVRFG
jgi:uncharacterized membrane protein YdjX (TVP38/TMEM64 family)